MKRTQKEQFVEELASTLNEASALVLVDYAGLSVKLQQELKKELREIDATMVVVKNTLFRLASQKIKAPETLYETETLEGPTALIRTSGDPIAPLQVIAKFAKANEIPQFKAGLIEGSFQDKSGLSYLSQLPGKDALVAQAMGAIASPLYSFVGTIQAPMQQLINVLSQAAKK